MDMASPLTLLLFSVRIRHAPAAPQHYAPSHARAGIPAASVARVRLLLAASVFRSRSSLSLLGPVAGAHARALRPCDEPLTQALRIAAAAAGLASAGIAAMHAARGALAGAVARRLHCGRSDR